MVHTVFHQDLCTGTVLPYDYFFSKFCIQYEHGRNVMLCMSASATLLIENKKLLQSLKVSHETKSV